jgi:hypothetical protein
VDGSCLMRKKLNRPYSRTVQFTITLGDTMCVTTNVLVLGVKGMNHVMLLVCLAWEEVTDVWRMDVYFDAAIVIFCSFVFIVGQKFVDSS